MRGIERRAPLRTRCLKKQWMDDLEDRIPMSVYRAAQVQAERVAVVEKRVQITRRG
jgi:hypothetical protein